MSENSVANSVRRPLREGKNGGSLKTGNPGNTGGGRRPDHIRAAARESLDRALDVLHERLGTPETLTTMELLKVLDLLLRYGIGPAQPENCAERPSAPMSEIIRSW
jgi:hypothetical protein